MANVNNKSGFTLIEVVIVLAIAGLIFVIVFLAVSAAQASRRDNERKEAAGRVVSAANSQAGNSGGAIPGTCPSATYYNNQNNTYPCGTAAPAAGTPNAIQYMPNTSCNNNVTPNTTAAAPGHVTARYWSEKANNVLCVGD